MAQPGDLIIVGTYEEFVVGYTIVPEDDNEKKWSLVQTIACHSHKGSVRSLANGGAYLASGSLDETVQLYDVVNQVECTLLNHHSGTVNALAFTENGTHLITAGADGMIAIIRSGSWFTEKKWVGTHSGSGVTGLSVHPSGKLALSIGTDNRLVTWNLVKGRKAYVTDLSSRCRNGQGVGDVQWSPSGSSYAVYMTSHVEVYSVETAGVSHTITCSEKVTAITFLDDDVILVGEENGEASVHKLLPPSKSGEEGEKEEVVRFQAHERRVKCARSFGPVKDAARDAIQFVTASSTGNICVWELEDDEVEKICEVNTGCRITCMTLVDLAKELQIKLENDEAAEKAISKDISQINSERSAKTLRRAKKRTASESSDTSIVSKKKSSSQPNSLNSPSTSLKKEKRLKKKIKKNKSSSAGQWDVSSIE